MKSRHFDSVFAKLFSTKIYHCEGSRGFALGFGRRLGLGFHSFQSFKSRSLKSVKTTKLCSIFSAFSYDVGYFVVQVLKVQHLNSNRELICCKACSIAKRKKIPGLLSETTLFCNIFHVRFIDVRDIVAHALSYRF